MDVDIHIVKDALPHLITRSTLTNLHYVLQHVHDIKALTSFTRMTQMVPISYLQHNAADLLHTCLLFDPATIHRDTHSLVDTFYYKDAEGRSR